MRAPIPQRIAPLTWRKPAVLCTPLALICAIGWPAAAFWQEPNIQRLTLAAGMIVFALALCSLGASWTLGRAPRTRLTAVLHVVGAGAAVALLAPFALTELLAAASGQTGLESGAVSAVSLGVAMAPLALIVGLPIATVSGVVFAWLALARGAQT
ncbi:MAG TPA: hypothetical protein VEA80_04115 [Vitreimonas sp.]|uniref:hypothetical protein n=1 Tax=Vitreimonas sp. TaxID=3069702 RepID=UPI002D5E1BBB|nr:hypothetical protein [Vitreimonas sp.]HYD86636.1 hypothetical protein [Vitreimonas sp.]